VKQLLTEYIPPVNSRSIIESKDDFDYEGKPTGKSLYLKGIMIQGGIRNQNQRVYPVREIERAVRTLQDQLKNNYSVLGELNHPSDLNINLDRVSHCITDMWMEGADGCGKLKILPTPLGDIAKTLLHSGIRLGVSSRGSGNVKEDGSGEVSDFEIITVDIVSTPSAPGSYPSPIYEHLMNSKGGYKAMKVAKEVQGDIKAQKYIKESLLKIIGGLQ
jgi:hypothetical protein